MNRLSDFQKATEAAQLDQKAAKNHQTTTTTPAAGSSSAASAVQPLYQPFQKSSQMERGEAAGLSRDTETEIPPPIITAEDEQMEMPRFFAQANEIKDSNKRVQLFTDEIEKLHKNALSTPDASESAALSGQIGALTAKVNQMANRTRRTLQEMDAVTGELAAASPRGSGNLRMRQSNHRQLSQSFLDAMKGYQKVQEVSQAKYQAQLKRQYLIVKPHATKAELASLTADPEAMRVQVFALTVRGDAQATLTQMKSRLQDMQNIEKSILELNQMFLQMQDLVVSQGEVINRIEYNVDQIEDYTAQSAKNMDSALESQKAIQKKKWYIIMIIAVIVGLVIVCVVVSVLMQLLPNLIMLKILKT